MLYFLNEIGLAVENLGVEEQKGIQFLILSESGFLEEFEKSIFSAIWMFAKNVSQTPLITSDHPNCNRGGDILQNINPSLFNRI